MKKIISLSLLLFSAVLLTFSLVQAYADDSCGNSSSNYNMSTADQSPKGNNGKVIDIPNTEYFNGLISNSESRNTIADRHIILDFTATWCGPCKQFKPLYEFVAADYAGLVDFYRIDIDKNKELAELFEVKSIPYLVFIPVKGDPTMGGVPQDLYDAINSAFGLNVPKP